MPNVWKPRFLDNPSVVKNDLKPKYWSLNCYQPLNGSTLLICALAHGLITSSNCYPPYQFRKPCRQDCPFRHPVGYVCLSKGKKETLGYIARKIGPGLSIHSEYYKGGQNSLREQCGELQIVSHHTVTVLRWKIYRLKALELTLK
ncbi:hypothetical protein J6590_067408 [Homalodisca vitripennis]|nr:hypothetical protein J6590_067408 [Homalodisca vitripennis]